MLAVGASPSGQASLSTARVEVDVGAAGERAALVAGQRDQCGAAAAKVGGERDQLVGLARVRQHDDHVVGRDHAEVAVARLGRVHEERGRARGGQRGGELAPHVAGLADAGNDHAPTAAQDEADGRDERGADALPEGGDRTRLHVQHVAREREDARFVECRRGAVGEVVHCASIPLRPRRIPVRRRRGRGRFRARFVADLVRARTLRRRRHARDARHHPRPARRLGGRGGRVPPRPAAADPGLPPRGHRRRPARRRLGRGLGVHPLPRRVRHRLPDVLAGPRVQPGPAPGDEARGLRPGLRAGRGHHAGRRSSCCRWSASAGRPGWCWAVRWR